MIRGTCPQCRRTYEVDDQFAGRSGHCRACGATVTVPGRPVPSGGPAAPSGLPAAAGQAPAGPAPTLQSFLNHYVPAAPSTPPPAAQTAPANPAHGATNATGPPHAPEHFARLSFEPEHGPTALEGPWITDAPAATEPEAAPAQAPKPHEVLSGKLVTPVEDVPDVFARPLGLTLACLALAVLGLAFAALFAWRGGSLGIVLGTFGALLVALGLVRLWTGYLDGLIPAIVFVVCVVATVLFVTFGGPASDRATEGSPPQDVLSPEQIAQRAQELQRRRASLLAARVPESDLALQDLDRQLRDLAALRQPPPAVHAAPEASGLEPPALALLLGAALTLLLLILASARTAGYLFLSQHR